MNKEERDAFFEKYPEIHAFFRSVNQDLLAQSTNKFNSVSIEQRKEINHHLLNKFKEMPQEALEAYVCPVPGYSSQAVQKRLF